MTVDGGLMDAVRPVLKGHEGERFHVYPDPLGIPTIGVGFNLAQPGARLICESVGANYEDLLYGRTDLTPEQSDAILTQCVISTVEWLTMLFPMFSSYSIPRRVGLIDMGFMGQAHFKQFHHLIADVLAGDWPDVQKEEMDSKWALQVGSRAHDDFLLFAQA